MGDLGLSDISFMQPQYINASQAGQYHVDIKPSSRPELSQFNSIIGKVANKRGVLAVDKMRARLPNNHGGNACVAIVGADYFRWR